MVQVVSMLEVPMRFGSISFQSKDVKGAQNSEDLELLRTVGGVAGEPRWWRRRKSAEEARRLGEEGWKRSFVGG
ncbi:hypothetical protein MLD38_029222 [Melastoma candidum]|uniref:Uncharacterized protein n=1 Tax=Melastoma candidum TaxID=119954 RepID=A0ACB9N334_9MYRT|nr:hypothetical protein MLD38_029222 [Melastoma candidum]